MTAGSQPAYTPFHPRWYRKRVSTWWWLGQWQYLKFILREISSIFVALAVGTTLWEISALHDGAESYAQFQQRMHSPGMIALGIITLGFVIFHAITWFNLTPRAMPAVRIGGKRVPEAMIALPNYIAWIVVSAFVAWVVLR
jgi:fumarate reductase subunit C